jgi:hypothetical protein
MRLSLNFGDGIGTRTVELANTTEEDYAAIEEYFTPLINSTHVKLREAIADAFAFALGRCPYENPSDLWHHILYRIYCRQKKGTNASQSWVRTSGEAFELALAQRYNPILQQAGIRLTPLFSKTQKRQILTRMDLVERVGSSKIDVAIEKRGASRGIEEGYGIIGGIHAKVSLAERVSDDIPASRIMMAEKFLSILSTLDVKSFPPPHGDLVNRGELGSPTNPSDKRRYVEEHSDFSACFSYNTRTIPSPPITRSGKRIYVVDLNDNPDVFAQFVLETTS